MYHLKKNTSIGECKTITNLQFKAIGPITTNSTDDEFLITGVVSTTSEDLYGDIVTREALESLKKQMIGLNVFLDHDYNYDKVIGVVKSSELSDDKLYATVAVTKDYQEDIKSKIEFGVNLGFSIGGFADRDKNNTNLISDFNLIELSLTPLPANWDSYGSVASKNGVMVGNCITQLCYKMLKSENMAENIPQDNNEETLTFDKVKDLIDEAITEKEEQITADIMSNIQSQIDDAVNAKLKEYEENQPEPVEPTTGEGTDEKAVKEEPSEDEGKEKEEKRLNELADIVVKKLETAKQQEQENKLQQFIDTKNLKPETFLNSETRDQFGRNKKFL